MSTQTVTKTDTSVEVKQEPPRHPERSWRMKLASFFTGTLMLGGSFVAIPTATTGVGTAMIAGLFALGFGLVSGALLPDYIRIHTKVIRATGVFALFIVLALGLFPSRISALLGESPKAKLQECEDLLNHYKTISEKLSEVR